MFTDRLTDRQTDRETDVLFTILKILRSVVCIPTNIGIKL